MDSTNNDYFTPEELEKRKQNALFNLDFEEYKKHVKQEFKQNNSEENYLEKIKKLEFVDGGQSIKHNNNMYLVVGALLILFATILLFQ